MKSPLCANCGKPLLEYPWNEAGYPVYHGECWPGTQPPADPKKPIELYNHDQRVQDGLECP